MLDTGYGMERQNPKASTDSITTSIPLSSGGIEYLFFYPASSIPHPVSSLPTESISLEDFNREPTDSPYQVHLLVQRAGDQAQMRDIRRQLTE
jgi:hypothetical protein